MLISLATPCHRKRRQVLASSMNVPQKGFSNWYMYLTHSRASATQTVAKWSYRTKGIEPHACIEIENYATLFFMVNMASSMVHRCVCPMMKKQMSHNMAAILQLIPSLGLQRTSLILDMSDIDAMFNDTCQYKVSANQYSRPYRGLKVRAHQDHVVSF